MSTRRSVTTGPATERVFAALRVASPAVKLRIFTEPQQGATYDQLLAVARLAEELGFDAFFRSDHFLHMGDGSPGPGSTDAWVTLAAIGRETSRIRLGTLVTPVDVPAARRRSRSRSRKPTR